ncbi:probable chitinase 10 isoform X2 [Hyposmocoma kahamanoa]|uniref:probable chitinase 10 isoform X2 n=1 Tax=Hyposmocoma kahamanoa TaxID=1477025 RepID=UPI000E6D775B|nr:probable chitinase 10 isoform X2 [Hyposmocoma kahamanoa]
MGHKILLQCAYALVLCVSAIASPRSDINAFIRSTVETAPEHKPLAPPIRSSVESVPFRSLRAEGEGRLPLRDAVEKRPISVLDEDTYTDLLYKYKSAEDAESIPDNDHYGNVRLYYGAASYLNNISKNDERLQQGNANLQEMQQTASAPAVSRMVVCYLQSWAAYRAPPLAFTAGLVPKSCTHLHYAFAVLHPHTYAVLPANEDYDVIKGGYRIATGLKRRHPGLKVLISVGGDGTARLFSEMAQEPNRRSSFIESAVNFLREHDFDGLDLHWVYPGEKDDREKALLTRLLYELREKFSSYGLLLSTVLPPFRYQIEDGYDLSAVSGATDYAILQAWDMTHGKRDEPPSRAVQHSALHRDPGASSRDQRYDNIEFMAKYIIRHGMAPDKLVLGVPLFGRSYTLAASTLPAPGAAISGWGDEGQYTQSKGLLAYFEICMMERESKGASALDESGNSYAVFDNQWVTYDSPSNVIEKMKFVVNTGLAGAAAWAVDMDDFRGLCGSPFPILSAMSTSLNGEAIQTDQSSLKVGSCDSDSAYLASDEESCAHFYFCNGGINYKLVCEENRLYDPSTGYCGHQDVAKCLPGQSLRISIADASKYSAEKYETDFEWGDDPIKDIIQKTNDAQRLLAADQTDAKKGKANNKKVVCYMTSWAFYRRGDGKFVPEHIDSRLCTHVVYAYASLTPDNLVAKEFDPWADINNNLYERVTSLSDVNVLLGLGGWTDSAGDKYSRLVSSSSARSKFIQKLIPFLRMHNFDGLHLDWNYPVCWQSNCKKGARSDKANYATFVQELSLALHGAHMELGIAVSGYKEVIEAAYDLPSLSKSVDFLSAMTYDYHGGWERTTAHHTPIVPNSNDPLAYYSIEYAIKALIGGGADPKKLLLGLSFYGQSFRLADVEGPSGPGAPAAGPGEPGEFTKQPGMLAYYEICYRVKNLRWKTGRQDKAGPYAYSDNQWVGYDDPKSIKEKVEWALRQGLGGVTAWAIDLDDFSNRCCTEPSPLLRAAGRALGRAVPAPPKSPCERPPEPVTPAPPITTPAESDGSMTSEHHHGQHEDTSTTWPSWKPSSSTTAQTWWPSAATTPSMTTTTTRRPTQAPTTRPPASRPPPTNSGNLEGTPCRAGEHRAAPGDCSGYLQCEGGQWRKHRCAPGLHWSATSNRCDWPNFANCNESPNNQASTATTTLAPMTPRPPRPDTTTRTTTTTTNTTTTSTTSKPTTQAPVGTDDTLEGTPCNGQDYREVPRDCNSYLHCDGRVWRQQNCAPGLHWSQKDKHCDWPKYAKCKDQQASRPTTSAPKPTRPPRPTRPPTTISSSDWPKEGGECGGNEMHAPASTCDAYLLCVSGNWRKQLCPPGLHWDKRTNRCDWTEFAMCEKKPDVNKSPMSATTTRKPTYTTTKKPIIDVDPHKPSTRCTTGSYYPHPKCEKFFVCVNGMMIAQSCAPGLVWHPGRSQCDFPSPASCNDRRQIASAALTDASKPQNSVQIIYCQNGEYAMLPSDCTRYQHCLFGKFEEFACSAGLHWNQDKQICDWPKNANCKPTAPATSPRPLKETAKPVKIPVKPPKEPEHTYHDTPPVPSKPVHTKPSTGTSSDVGNKPALINSRYKLVCYYTNWSWYRPGLGKYTPEDIDPTLCTHIVYGFAVLSNDGLITAHDSWADYDNRFYERVVEYKRHGIKVSIALGGWNDSAGNKYSKLVNDPAARKRFVTHALQFIEKYNFDGLDLDWEYPKCWQVDCSKGPDSDKTGFSDLVRELSSVFKPKGLLLSAAVSPNKMVIDEGYDVPTLARHLDWIAVMTYDYHGQWDKKTGHVAPLFYHPEDDVTYFNANYTIHYWMQKGAPPSKLVMGMPLYGQTFTLETQWESAMEVERRKDFSGLNIPAASGGEAGEYTRAKGFLAYYEICERIRNQGWQLVQDPTRRMGPYAYKDNQWVSFDDQEMLKKKVNFIKSLNLAGGMVWALDLDDFRNRCDQGVHPLINTIKNGLLDPSIDYESLQPSPVEQSTSPIKEPANQIEEDLDDIEVILNRPTTQKATKLTTKPQTQKPPILTTLAPIFKEERYKIVCYYTNWAWYRPGSGKYTPDDIDPTLCTHIVYAFAVLDSNKLVIKPHDTWLDVEHKFYEKVIGLRRHGVRVVLGLGGWNDSAGDKYSRLVNNASARRKFIVHALDFIEQFGFDGLDLDWEYPKCWQADCDKGPSSDKAGFTSLVKELRTAFSRRGLLLSAAVSASKRVIDAGYDVPTLSENLDWISLMTYDYHGQWEKKTGHVAPMYVQEDANDQTLNANFTVHYWLKKGASREKLIMGLPFYGQSFSMIENAGTGLGVPTFAGGEPGDETRARGFLAFYEICERIRSQGWQVARDAGGRMGPYATLHDQWVSFDDDFMIRHKAEYIRALDLGGGMIWSLDLDDFTGQYCGCGKSPLLRNINFVLRGQEAPSACLLEEIQGPSSVDQVGGTEEVSSAGQLPLKPQTELEDTPHEIQPHTDSESDKPSYEGVSCREATFRGDDNDCRKYYLCINGQYTQLKCPEQLHWNKNHCDWPEKSHCRHKANLRLTAGDEILEVLDDKPILACYFTNWAYYRRDDGKFGPEQVDPTLCTHIIYTWAHLDDLNYELVPGNLELDVDNDFYGKITGLRVKGVKVILGVGGLKDSENDKWNRMAVNKEHRKEFINSALKVLRRWNFDGLQLGWQYPVCKQISCTQHETSEKENFSTLVLELSGALRAHNLEFSTVVSATPEIAQVAYDFNVLTAAVDWTAIAANDYYASTTGRTAYLVPLETPEAAGINSFNSTLTYWASVMPPRQLVMGVPAYARSYTLRSASNAAVGALVAGPGQPGLYTDFPGFLAYNEVCTGLRSKEWLETQTLDGTFAVYNKQWSSYLRPEEVHRVASSVVLAGLRGVSLWALDLDDWRGTCGCESYPLLTALRQGLSDPHLPPTTCLN